MEEELETINKTGQAKNAFIINCGMVTGNHLCCLPGNDTVTDACTTNSLLTMSVWLRYS